MPRFGGLQNTEGKDASHWARRITDPVLPGLCAVVPRSEFAAQVDVSAKYPGRLEEISVEEGTKVAIGQAIARVSSPEGEVTLVSPKNGEIQYLFAGRGDTIAGGESIVTIIDLTDIYMTVFLPAADASKLGIGDEARVILDAAPDYVIPAAVSFLASDTRISPKSVETKEERAKQTFRVDLRI